MTIPFTDKGFREVTEVAGGSSFNGTRFSGEAHKMNVNERWKKYATDPEYRKLFDPELEELDARAFGDIPHFCLIILSCHYKDESKNQY